MYKNKMNLIIEELSHIEIQVDKDSYVLWDKMSDQKFDINQTFYEVCMAIDGKKTLDDMAFIIADKYGVNIDEVRDDVFEIYSFLRRNKLILCKETIEYRLIKFYNKAIFVN